MPVASIEGGDLAKVWEVKTLGRPRDAEARSLLLNIANQVQPIMRKRKWRVMLLSEFYPRNPALLGLNIGGGQEIRIRLRKPGRESEFLPYEALVGTMLHELTHNEHGPHDAKFYKLLDEITKECEELMSKGISGTGQGFDAPGQRLGGYSYNPPDSRLRQAALAAAEKRARTGSLMPSGPRRLGGDSVIMQALSPIQAAAMAAERRLRDDLWCAAPDTVREDGSNKAQEREDASGPGLIKENAIKPSSPSNTLITASSGLSGTARDNQREASDASLLNETLMESCGPMWECSVCTLFNPPLAMICGACSTARVEKSTKNWSCKFCTLENSTKLDKCTACNQWRYSYGPPAATVTPYAGT
ncbi:hypothetical protein GOP47_0017669 [Adiantum capillus-veneris]|uniref:WLM-domain-containing protein n=1 Tax=Adiantum capillus-veneris TaxID=13818 RepID=A0A9D4UGZ6_ADICA|nr:hypothetical protein GOP47_0017669 [Adiantum capillus-veneris]